ncbi:MAG: hypothetical protein H6728_02775 [Myxococcales bacterium]|nr:hypothetical protein [Myxococcales bacterium]
MFDFIPRSFVSSLRCFVSALAMVFFAALPSAQATPTPPAKTPSPANKETSAGTLSPSMQLLWRLHNEQLRLVESNVIYRGKKKLELTFLGGGYEQVFQGSPKALKLASGFHSLQIGGFVLSSVGLGATLAGTLIVILLPQAVIQPQAGGVLGPELFWGLLLGGTALSLIGSVLAQSSYGMLYRAVDIYNQEIFEKAFRDVNGGQLPQARKAPPRRGKSVLYAATH